MSYLLPPDSSMRVQAVAFGRELRRAMKARGLGSRSLGVKVGYGRTNICQWLAGNTLPRAEKAAILAEVLDWPRLEHLVVRARTGACATCGGPFVNESGGPKRYCSSRCLRVADKKRGTDPARLRADIAERHLVQARNQLPLYRDAVAAFCRSCEPGGVCHMAYCELRPVSPLPLI